MGSGSSGLFLDVGEELKEVLRVFLEHLLGADETQLAHLVEIGQPFDLLVFLLQEHLNLEHFSLLLNEVPPILSILRTLNRYVEARLSHVDLVCDVWVDG